MFESTAVESRRRRRSPWSALLFTVSIILHAVAVLVVVGATMWNVQFPVNTPTQLVSFSLAATPPPPPPPPPPARRRPLARRSTPKPKPVEIPQALQNMAPTMIPDEIPEPVYADEDVEDEAWIEGGLYGGVAGGAVGGVLGGVLEEAPPPPPDPSKGPLRVGGDVKAPIPIDAPPPVYPETAMNKRLDGTVTVEAIIDKRGRVQNLRTVRSSDPIFEAAAIEAVARWKFRPGTLWGEPVDTVFKLTVNFEMLRRGRKKE